VKLVGKERDFLGEQFAADWSARNKVASEIVCRMSDLELKVEKSDRDIKLSEVFVIEGLVVTAIITVIETKTLELKWIFCWWGDFSGYVVRIFDDL
jgi:hypothetical protein